MEITMDLRLTAAVLVALAGLSGPALALDNGTRSNSDDIRAACEATHRACLVACYSIEGNTFHEEFYRQGCEIGCDQAYQACLKSIPLTMSTARQSRPKNGVLTPQ
jgi:hypothetical protein